MEELGGVRVASLAAQRGDSRDSFTPHTGGPWGAVGDFSSPGQPSSGCLCDVEFANYSG